jgi:peptidylprolyl isomerase
VKITALISFFLAIIVLSACGGSSDSSPPLDEIVWGHSGPEVVLTHTPVPKKLIVKDVRLGKGAVLAKGRVGTFKYKDFDYRTGQNYENWWDTPFITGFGKHESLGAWETGLKGMRVGGRRLLYVPPAQAYTHVPVIYAIELVAVK